MKKTTIALCMLAMLMCLPNVASAKKKCNLNVCTFNISYDSRDESNKAWKNRGYYIHDLMCLLDLDVLGTNEGTETQLQSLAGPDYDYIQARGFWNRSEPPIENTQHLGIFYKKSRIKLLDHGSFWLSPTPNQKSWGWDAAESRGCLWAKLKDTQSGRTFFYFCSHLDHMGKQARVEEAKLILDSINTIAKGYPVMWGGDFNGGPSSEHVKYIKENSPLVSAYDVCKGVRYGSVGTMCGYDNSKPQRWTWPIDHIFLTPGITVNRYGVLAEFPMLQPLSDHLPVYINVTF